MFEINGQIGRLEAGLTGVESRLSKAEEKLEAVHLDVNGAKKILWAFGIVLSGLSGVGLLLLSKILDAVLKHVK